ncbi:MAG: hypothetical protein QOE33_3463 [Acidobacteriota bacterium]|nr:hypothetical protein [Acidobacteriota bacterium]
MSEESNCPCEGFTHPKLISNPPGLERIAYRVGDYASFRHALLLSRAGETELANWRPSARGDLALQLVEWWAYLADVLTFYNERVMSESFLGTAELPESVKRLIEILGYRPRPGIGATGIVAALLSGRASVTLPQGFQIQSKPGAGKEPQIFELEEQTTVVKPDVVAADAPAQAQLISLDEAGDATVLLKGVVSSVKAGDDLLLMRRGWNGTDDNYALVTVKDVRTQKDPRGQSNTRVSFDEHPALPKNAQAADYRLLKSSQTSKTYQYVTDHVVVQSHVHLESLKRDIKAGDPLLLVESAQTPVQRLVNVTLYEEPVWYANADSATTQDRPPASQNTPGIPVPHSRIYFVPVLADDVVSSWNNDRGSLQVLYGWRDVGQLMATPAATFDGKGETLTAVAGAFPVGGGTRQVLLEDADGRGTSGAGMAGNSTVFQLNNLAPLDTPLTPPLNVLFNLLKVSRGKTVRSETLGSGDARVAAQEFVLKKSPLTYLLGGDSSGDGYRSTLRVWVDGIEWKEVASFYGQRPDARIFVTREDADNKTHVMFGDGINGARLSSGVNNVVAQYRYGSGADAPEAGKLSVIAQPQPNLKAIHNPLAAGGGADPDPPAQIRRYAPRSVLTFGRAVSGDDYEAIAAQAPGVSRARTYWAFDPDEQRTSVVVYVGDDQSAVEAAKLALKGAGDPNRPVIVKQAREIQIKLYLTLEIDRDYDPTMIVAAARSALLDDETGLFGRASARIGQIVYRSRIFEACLRVPGAVAVHGLQFFMEFEYEFYPVQGFRFNPGEGGFFRLGDGNLYLAEEVAGSGV